MVMKTVVFLTTSESLAQEGNEFVNRYILLCKYTPTAGSDASLSIQNGMVKSKRAKTRWLHNEVHREHRADSSKSFQCHITFFQQDH